MQGIGVVFISLLILAKNVRLPPELRGFIFYAQVRDLDDCIIIYSHSRNTIEFEKQVYKSNNYSIHYMLCFLLQVIGLVFGPFSNVINTELKVSLFLYMNILTSWWHQSDHFGRPFLDPFPLLPLPMGTHTMYTPAEFASLPQLAHLLCATSLVCLHQLAYPRRGTPGLRLSSASTSHSHCVQHNVSPMFSTCHFVMLIIY